ncbi:MAG: UDP-glucose 4-epimerase GalE [Proteobacteria bacterium]|nr:UDP-glucose 4-epimerase GalE [Pseudomonadota bacterium]
MSKNVNSVLVTGGAGYIGSHVVSALLDAQVTNLVVLDNLSTGFKESLTKDINFVLGDIQDFCLLSKLLAKERIDTVIHLAAKTVIPESITFPQRYYQNNTFGTLNLLQACVENKVKNFIYSSTAAVYGKAEHNIAETCSTKPINPYGHSKLMAEQMLIDTAKSYPLNYVILRYFNVAGADPSTKMGQRTLNATHLIKAAVQTACKIVPYLAIFGTDYPTPDGTCIRDYIHVSDLANAHLSAMQYLNEEKGSAILNCGYGRGYSVKQVIKTLEKITNESLPVLIAPARAGDLPQVVAQNTKIKSLLKWAPQFDDIEFIIRTALAFEQKMLNIKHF